MEKLFLQVLVTACVASALLLVLLFPARRWLENRYGAQQARKSIWQKGEETAPNRSKLYKRAVTVI